eukprot:14469711-Alexandrium_andersonii.AAC.1
MPRSKGVGPDMTPIEVWQAIAPHVGKDITCLFGAMVEESRVPSSFCGGTIVPIPKRGGESSDPKSHRGLALMNHIAKCFL